MPKKSHLKTILPKTYYFVSNTGIKGSSIFKQPSDYAYFVSCFERYLSSNIRKDKQGRVYKSLSGSIELVCYGLVEDKYEILFFVKDPHSLPKLIRGVMAAYSTYFNSKYNRTGTMFGDRYDAVEVEPYELLTISRYIHMLPDRLKKDGFTSLGIYISRKESFLKVRHLYNYLEVDYLKFLTNDIDLNERVSVVSKFGL